MAARNAETSILSCTAELEVKKTPALSGGTIRTAEFRLTTEDLQSLLHLRASTLASASAVRYVTVDRGAYRNSSEWML